MSQYHLRKGALASLVYVILSAIAPPNVLADTPLTRADVSAFQNRVDILLRGGPTRPVRLSDWLSVGDAIETQRASQVDLRFNDGSLARVGELATFWFVPNTRNFRLANGTVLLLIPPGSGPSTIETPNVVTGIQGTALLVRYFPPGEASDTPRLTESSPPFASDRGRTAVLVLTDSPAGPVDVRLRDGRQVPLKAGQMAIVDDQDLYLFEFDLNLFYETSPILEGLALTERPLSEGSQPTNAVRQEIRNSLAQQDTFNGDYLLNPSFLGPSGGIAADGGWLFPASSLQNPPANTPSQTIPDAPESTAVPHDTSGPLLELEPSPDGSSDPDGLGSGSDSDELPNRLPPGVIMPPANEGFSPNSPEAFPVEPNPAPTAPLDDAPDVEDVVPDGDNGDFGDD